MPLPQPPDSLDTGGSWAAVLAAIAVIGALVRRLLPSPVANARLVAVEARLTTLETQHRRMRRTLRRFQAEAHALRADFAAAEERKMAALVALQSTIAATVQEATVVAAATVVREAAAVAAKELREAAVALAATGRP